MSYQLVPAAATSSVHPDKEGRQQHSSITPLADGGALVVFEENVIPDSDDFNSRDVAVLARRYDATGNAVGDLMTIESEDGVASDDYRPFAARPHRGRICDRLERPGDGPSQGADL